MVPGPEIIKEILSFETEIQDFGSIPTEVVGASREIIVNAAAAGLAGAAQQDGHTITHFVQDMGGNGKCTIIGKGLRTSPVYAALANAVLIRLLDFDDEVVANSAHPGSAIFPVVMALGEMNGSPGQDVLRAFAAGYEVTSKLRTHMAEAGLSQGAGAWAEAVGASLAAGMLLKLDEKQLRQAVILAGGSSDTPPMPPGTGPVMAYAQGRAAMGGIMAGLLASQGLAAVPEGNFPTATGEPYPHGSVGKNLCLGAPFAVLSPGVGLKLYPCAAPAHTAVDACLQLVQQYRFGAGEVAAVAVGCTAGALQALPYPTPGNGWEARACLSFVVASALTYGQPLIDNFSEAAVADPRVRELMDRITVEATETPLGSMLYPTSVAITLADGRQISHRAEAARGLAELPLSPEELDAKFLYCSRYILPPDHIEEAITRIRDLENIENTTGLFSVLGG